MKKRDKGKRLTRDERQQRHLRWIKGLSYACIVFALLGVIALLPVIETLFVVLPEYFAIVFPLVFFVGLGGMFYYSRINPDRYEYDVGEFVVVTVGLLLVFLLVVVWRLMD